MISQTPSHRAQTSTTTDQQQQQEENRHGGNLKTITRDHFHGLHACVTLEEFPLQMTAPDTLHKLREYKRIKNANRLRLHSMLEIHPAQHSTPFHRAPEILIPLTPKIEAEISGPQRDQSIVAPVVPASRSSCERQHPSPVISTRRQRVEFFPKPPTVAPWRRVVWDPSSPKISNAPLGPNVLSVSASSSTPSSSLTPSSSSSLSSSTPSSSSTLSSSSSSGQRKVQIAAGRCRLTQLHPPHLPKPQHPPFLPHRLPTTVRPVLIGHSKNHWIPLANSTEHRTVAFSSVISVDGSQLSAALPSHLFPTIRKPASKPILRHQPYLTETKVDFAIPAPDHLIHQNRKRAHTEAISSEARGKRKQKAQEIGDSWRKKLPADLRTKIEMRARNAHL